jgi:hypothetical protein
MIKLVEGKGSGSEATFDEDGSAYELFGYGGGFARGIVGWSEYSITYGSGYGYNLGFGDKHGNGEGDGRYRYPYHLILVDHD